MKFLLVHNIPSVLLLSLVLLSSAQRTSHNLKDVGIQELARQNKITKQILEAFIQKKLGLSRGYVRPPSIQDIIPTMMEQKNRHPEPEPEDIPDQEEEQGGQEVSDDEGLQSVESEQIDSIYSEGRSKKYPSPPFEPELESYRKRYLQSGFSGSFGKPSYDNSLRSENDYKCTSCNEDELGVTRWTMPLLKSGEKRYYLGIFFKANWFKAQQYCRFHGMHLASISSQQENDKLEQYVKDSGYGREHFWTSGTDLAEEGNFFWMANGRPLTFVNWNAGEPNNFRYENGEEENCLELWNRDDKGLKWNDSPCSFETFFICEVRSD